MKSKLVLLCSFIVLSLFSFGQKTASTYVLLDSTLDKKLIEIDLLESSEPKEVFFRVSRKIKSITIKFSATLKNGKCKMGIYDPKGEMYGRYLVLDSKYSGQGNVVSIPNNNSPSLFFSGRFNWVIKKPKPGKWKIILLPENANGNIQISYSIAGK